jgi:hypothetical protein
MQRCSCNRTLRVTRALWDFCHTECHARVQRSPHKAGEQTADEQRQTLGALGPTDYRVRSPATACTALEPDGILIVASSFGQI